MSIPRKSPVTCAAGMCRGFTLIEAIVVIGLFTAGMLVLASLYGDFNALYKLQNALAGTAGSAAAVVNETAAVTLPAGRVLASHAFLSGTYDSGSTVLVVEIPAIDSNGNVIVGKYDYAALYASAASAYRVLETDAASSRTPGIEKLGGPIVSLSFTYDNADVAQAKNVAVQVTTQTFVKGSPVTSVLSGSFRLRNHV